MNYQLVAKWLAASRRMRIALPLAGLAFNLPIATSYALVFPLPPGDNAEYDADHNVLPSYSSGWTNRHAILNFHGANAVAIAPRWFLTAGHLAQGKDAAFWVNDDQNRYHILETREVSLDLALVRVDREFPFYSELRKLPVGTNELLTVYGQSAAAGAPVYNAQKEHAGWRVAPVDYRKNLRWGLGRALGNNPALVQWPFAAADPEIGINCAGVATNDSGGGIFTGSQLAAITIGGNSVTYRTNSLESSVGCGNPNDPQAAHLFKIEGLLTCFGDAPLKKQLASGTAIYPALSNIFAIISAPVRVNAGGPALASQGTAWAGWSGEPGASTFSDSSVEIDTAGLRNPAPPEVYRSELSLRGQPGAVLAFTAADLIRYERYTVRLHFSPLNTAREAGQSRQTIRVNGQMLTVDPFAGHGKASEVYFYEVAPDDRNRLTIEITPANPYGNATLSGIEIQMVPSWPAAQALLQWETVSFNPRVRILDTAFGRGRFVGVGTQGVYYSDDAGATWLPGGDVPPGRFHEILYANDMFIAAGGETGLIFSRDGRSWHACETPRLPEYRGLAFGNGRFVVSSISRILCSEDGENWRIAATPSNTQILHITYGNGRFLAIDLSNWFFTSTNGLDWVRYRPDFPNPDQKPCPVGEDCPPIPLAWKAPAGLAFGNGVFAACLTTSFAGSPWMIRTMVSQDGLTWKHTGTNGPGNFRGLGPLEFANERFIYLSPIASTPDFIQWESAAFGLATRANGVAYGLDHYVFPVFESIYFGTSLTNLRLVDFPPVQPCFTSFAAAADTLIGIDNQPGTKLPFAQSYDAGFRFHTPPLGNETIRFNGARRRGEIYLLAGENGTLLFSKDARDWTQAAVPGTNELYDVCYGSKRWIAVGAAGTILTSDGIGGRFTEGRPVTDRTLRAIAFGEGTFVAVGDGGTILHSSDGEVWEASETAGGEALYSVAYGEGQFVAVGMNGTIRVSNDGSDWRTVRSQAGQWLSAVEYASGIFLALERGTTRAFASAGGLSWAPLILPRAIYGISSSEGSLWLAGKEGYVARTAPLKLRPSRGESGLVLTHTAPGAPSGSRYELLSSGSPDAARWQVVTNFISQPNWTWRETNGPGARFFRLRAE